MTTRVVTTPTQVKVLQGPGGPAGPAGATGFTFQQTTSSAEWIINHNLGQRPTVTVFNVGGVEVEAQIVHLSTNQCRIYFATPTKGSARCI